MSFLNPSYLWALLGLLIPIAIHLWSKKEGKTIKVGSIKLLSEEDSKQSSSINLNELLLLFIRLLIVALVALIMAEPQFKRETQNTPLTYIIEPSLVNNDQIASLIDSLKSEFPVLLLQKEFPDITRIDTSNHETPNYWQLAKDMEMLKTDSIVVFTNAFLKGLIGKRPTINKPTDWIIFDTSQPQENLVEILLKKDSIQFLSTISRSDNLSFKKETISLNSNRIKLNKLKDSITFNENGKQLQHNLIAEQTLDVLLYHEDTFNNEARYLEATLKTISKYLNIDLKIHKIQDSTELDFSDYNRIIWLSETNNFKPHHKILSYKIDDLARSIISKGDTQNMSYITQPLTPKNILNNNFTKQLLSWLDLHPNLEKNSKRFDNRIVSKSELLPTYHQDSKKSNLYIETWSIVRWLCILLALLLIFERITAYLKKQ